MLGSKVSSSPVGPDGPAPRFSYSYHFIMARLPLFRQVLPQMLFESILRKAEKSFNISLKFEKRPISSIFCGKDGAKMRDDLQKVHNTDTVLPYFPVMIRPYPEEIDISHFSTQKKSISPISPSPLQHTQVRGPGGKPGPLTFFEKESKQRNFLRSSASPLGFKGQVPDLSLFVFPKPSPWGPTPLVKGRCPEGTEGIGKGAPEGGG